MLKIFRKDSLTPQTERIYKVPLFHRLGSCLIPLDATERLRALHSYYRMGDEASFSFNWNEYLHLKRDWRMTLSILLCGSIRNIWKWRVEAAPV